MGERTKQSESEQRLKFEELQRRIAFRGGGLIKSSADGTRELRLTGDSEWKSRHGDNAYDVFDFEAFTTERIDRFEVVLIEFAYLFDQKFAAIVDRFDFDHQEESMAKQKEYLDKNDRRAKLARKLIKSMEDRLTDYELEHLEDKS